MATTKTPALSDQDVAELIALTKGADSVELKLTVPVSDRSRGAAALGVDPLDAQIRQVYFFDTPELTLNKSGVVVRARRVQGKGDDTVVKLRPVVPKDLSGRAAPLAELRRRGRCDARRVRLLGIDEACAEDSRCQGRGVWEAAGQQALLQGAAGAVRGARTRGARAGRSRDPRPALRAQVEVHARGIRPQARFRALGSTRTTR